jgi:serine phosphatase RsbU (regulator of sigma subunit)
MALNMINEARSKQRAQRVTVQHEYRAPVVPPRGQDFISFNRTDEGGVTLLLGNVVAAEIQGVDAATSIMNTFALTSLFFSRPSEILSQLNNMLVAEAFGSGYALRANAIVCRFAPSVPYLQYASAAAPTPVIFRESSTYAALPSNGRALGTDASAAYDDLAIPFHAGDAFVAFTHGVTRSRRSSSIRGKVGVSGVVEAVWRALAHSKFPTCHDVFAQIDRKNGGTYADDATLVIASAFTA